MFSSPPTALLRVDNRNLAIDAEGYPCVLDDGSEDIPQAQIRTTKVDPEVKTESCRV